MKKGEKKSPAVSFNPFAALTPKEKEYLRGVLTNEAFVKMLSLAQKFRPSSQCKNGGSGDRDSFSNERAAIRLGEMRGWDLYQVSLFAVLSEKALKDLQVEATYPDSGRVDAKFGEIPPEKK